MKPSDYIPQYDESVKESLALADGTTSVWAIRGQGYCLSVPSARILASFFSPAPSLVMLPPITQAPGSPFRFNHDVPWLKFADGTLRNAGELATYWGMPGVPADQALSFAQLDISTPVGV